MTSLSLRDIAVCLRELTGLSIAELARRAGLHRPNLVSWLNGRSRTLSLANQLTVCETLGWHNGRLSRERVHRWQVGAEESALKRALTELETEEAGFGWADTVGGRADRGAVLIGLAHEEPPLVILVSRTPGIAPLSPLTTRGLGAVYVSQRRHAVTKSEWDCWWADTQNSEADAYLAGPGSFLREEMRILSSSVCNHFTPMPEPDVLDASLLAREREQSLNSLQQEWLMLLDEALASGVAPEKLKASIRALMGD